MAHAQDHTNNNHFAYCSFHLEFPLNDETRLIRNRDSFSYVRWIIGNISSGNDNESAASLNTFIGLESFTL